MADLKERTEKFFDTMERRKKEIIVNQEAPTALGFSRVCCCGDCGRSLIKAKMLSYPSSRQEGDLGRISIECVEKYRKAYLPDVTEG